MKQIPGGVTAPKGFRAWGVHCGVKSKKADKKDLALILSDQECAAAAVYTMNRVKAAPLYVTMEHLEDGTAWGVAANSGNANACCPMSHEYAEEMARLAARATGRAPADFVVASTGVIGQTLNIAAIRAGMPAAAAGLTAGPEGSDAAARAIMTTDTCPKHGSVSFSGGGIGYPGVTFTVGGMCKGAGMIMPNMATMIAVITTDAPIAAPDLSQALTVAVSKSFNKVTVDSDTSTNDTCFALASGAAAPEGPAFTPGTPAFDAFQRALDQLATTLARKMAADGEGATRLITVTVRGAATADDADAAARTVANSPLVKTAVYGHDANWGRVAAALGRSGARFNQEDVDIDILGLPVCRAGLVVDFDEEEALRRFEEPEVAIEVDLHAGEESATMWTCDFSHEYVTINGDYRS